jgi:hypothetical protein
MSLLKQVTRGVKSRPHFVLLYGVDGVGKSTFGATAPAPIFLGPEDGYGTLDVARFPTPRTWADVKAAVGELAIEAHDYKTLIIDSVDWIEPLVWAHVCRENQAKAIEQVGGGFGKGYVYAREQWQEFIRGLQALRQKMNIIAIAHAEVKTVHDPHENESYDRYQVKLNAKAADIWREAVDCVFFANYEVNFSKEKGARKAKAFGDGRRIMFTERRPAFDAKNRFDLPFQMDLSWEAFASAAAKSKPVSATASDDLLELFRGREAAALSYLISIEWLDEGEALTDLPAAKRKPILARPDDFRRAVDNHAKPENETPLT